MVNFYVPNYTKEEFEELDNKVLLLSKEKYSQLNIKFNDYDPTVDTRKIICSISYNDPKVHHIIYDDTLYDPYSGQLIGQTYKIFKNQLKSGAKLCITTYRYRDECETIEKLFPNIPIFATGRESKVELLRGLEGGVKSHYDDHLTLCLELLNTKICQPVFIKHHWMPNYDLPKELKIINITEVKQKGFRGLYG